jgi:hypothetical protein
MAFQNDLLQSAQNVQYCHEKTQFSHTSISQVLTGGFRETMRFEQGFMQGYMKARSVHARALLCGSRNKRV